MPATNLNMALRLLWLMHSPIEVTLPDGSWGFACEICGNYGFPCESAKWILAGMEASNG